MGLDVPEFSKRGSRLIVEGTFESSLEFIIPRWLKMLMCGFETSPPVALRSICLINWFNRFFDSREWSVACLFWINAVSGTLFFAAIFSLPIEMANYPPHTNLLIAFFFRLSTGLGYILDFESLQPSSPNSLDPQDQSIPSTSYAIPKLPPIETSTTPPCTS